MPNVRDAEQIKAIIDKRKITTLYHFTQLSNLGSIFERGLLPRAQLEKQGLESNFTDKYRLDNHPNATCCSVEFPNYKMFYVVRQKHGDAQWVVIELNPDILHEKECAFYYTNAASSEVRNRNINDFTSAQDLEDLFQEFEGWATRAQMKLPDNYPTDPQAEVLVFDQIEQKYIQAVYTNNKDTVDEWNAKNLGIKFVFAPNAFKAR